MCPNKLQDHLDLQASRLTSYDQVKAEVLAYLENVETRKEAKSGAVPMDVDSLAKGKGKGKQDKGKGKGKSKGKDKGKNQSSSWSNNSYHKGSWNNQSWNQQSWYKQNTNDSKSKGKGKKGQDKGKGKGDQGKSRKVANVESDAWTQEQPAATATGNQPEPELTSLFTLEDTMAPKFERPEESERRRADEARKKANEDKMKEMSQDEIPQWIHDKCEISSEEGISSEGEEFISRLEKLKTDPEVLSKLDNVLKEAYEKAYGEELDLGPSDETDPDDAPYNQEPAPGMEYARPLHWQDSFRRPIPFKELHEKCKTVSNKGYPYVKCQSCGKALNSMSIASFWQHVENKQCYPQYALEFWKKEHRQIKAEREAREEGESSKKRPMDDAEAKDEKRRQEIAKDEERKKRKQQFEEHYERFRYKGKDEVKPEVKKIPKRPGEKEKEKEEKKEEEAPRAPIELKSKSPSRAPEDSRADSAQASKGKGKFSMGTKRFLEKTLRDAANYVERKARKKKEKSPSPTPKEHSPRGGVRSDSNLDFLGNLASPVDTIVWATVDSGAATSCLPKELAQSLELAMTPVDEKPFTNASGQPVQVHGVCNPMVTMGEKGGPQVKGVGQFRAMDVAKPLLSVSKLVEKGWTVTFGPNGSFLQRGAKKVPVILTGGVFKIAMDFHGQPTEGLKA